MVTVFFKEAIDDAQELNFDNADNAFISDDGQFLILTSQEDDDITPKVCGRILFTSIIGYYIPY
jgi:hypothetical protein